MIEFEHLITAIDTHTEGQATRIVINGLPVIAGGSMAEKFTFLKQSPIHNRLREALMREPRGHRGMFGAFLTPPCDPRAHTGVVFTSTDEFFPMCVHGSIGVASALIGNGMVAADAPETVVVLDTAAGLVQARVAVTNGRAHSVTIKNTPAFLYQEDVALEVPGLGAIRFDIAFGGLFFMLVNGNQLGLLVAPENIDQLVQTGLKILMHAKETCRVVHPLEKHIQGIDCIEITGPATDSRAHSRNIVVIKGGLFDRSPCGTGTSARMAALHAKGQLKLGEEFVHESVIGSLFFGTLLNETTVAQYSAVIPEIRGSAYVTAMQHFGLDSNDPLKYGFSI